MGGVAGERTAFLAVSELIGPGKVTCWDADARVIPTPAALGQHEVAELLALPWTELIERVHLRDRGAVVLAWLASMRQPGAPVPVTFRYPRNGRWWSVDMAFVNLLDVPDVRATVAVERSETPIDPPRVEVTTDGSISSTPLWQIHHLDQLGRVTRCEGFTAAAIGFEPEELIGLDSSSWVHPDDLDLVITAWVELLAEPGGTRTVTFRVVHVNGNARWYEAMMTNRLHEPDVAAVVSLGYDIEERRRKEAALRSSEQQFRALAEEIPVAVFRADADGVVTYANDLFRSMLGEVRRLHNLSEVAGDWWDEVVGSLRSAEATFDVGDRVFRLRGRAQIGDSDVGTEWPILDWPGPVWHDAVQAVVGSVEDVTDVVVRERRLDELAHSDPLTGLANRRVLESTLEQALARSEQVLVVSMDLDGFKALNDEAGHHAGDQALIEIAGRLRHVVRPTDLVARLGGDEFVLVCHGIADSAVDDLVMRIRATVAEPLGERRDRHLFVSVGTTRTNTGDDAGSVLRRADLAMYCDKRQRAALLSR